MSVRAEAIAIVDVAGVKAAPAENETFFNVGAMSSRIVSMGRRIEQLKGLILEMRAAAMQALATAQGPGQPC